MSNRERHRIPRPLLGLLFVVAVLVGGYLALTKNPPWAGGFELRAVFASAQNVRAGSPVRIAGVEVGQVTGVKTLTAAESETAAPLAAGRPVSAAALVTMRLDDSALPIHADALAQLRPRLFLEGNLFVDLRPGSPSAPEVHDGYVIPLGQTSGYVQLDQVLTELQKPVRGDLQALLAGLGSGLQDHGGGEGLRAFNRASPGAFRYSAQVSEALLGQEPHDLSGVVSNLDQTFRALARDGTELPDLVTNFRMVSGSLASENRALQDAVSKLPGVLAAGEPALADLNAAFPRLRALAREAVPGLRRLPAAVEHATPLMSQLRGLLSPAELQGLATDLRPAVPDLAAFSAGAPDLLDQVRAISGCLNSVLVPWGYEHTRGDPTYPHLTGHPLYKELGYSLVGANGESRSGDANGQYVRAFTGTGTNLVALPPAADEPVEQFGVTPLPILGSMPALSASAKTPYRPDVPCETQEPPDLNGGTVGPAPSQRRASPVDPTQIPGPVGELARQFNQTVLQSAAGARDAGAGPRRFQKLVAAAYVKFMRAKYPSLLRQIRAEGRR